MRRTSAGLIGCSELVKIIPEINIVDAVNTKSENKHSLFTGSFVSHMDLNSIFDSS